MNYTKLKSYSANAISNILPVDRETCGELVDYALTLPTDLEIHAHFLNLLGESDETLAFLTKFMTLKKEANDTSKALANVKNVGGKADKESTHIPPTQTTGKNHKAWTSTPSGSIEHQQKGRLENNKTSKTTSELLDLKSPPPVMKQTKSSKKKKIDNLQDIEAVLNDLELSSRDEVDMESSSVIRNKCNCMGRRHPLFEVAPNCLNCGKIICAKEGLQPCSFCGKELLSFKDKWEIINLLREEKTNIENKQDPLQSKSPQDHVQSSHSKNKKKIVVTLNAGENLWRAQDTALKKMEADKKKNQELLDNIKRERDDIAQQAKEFQHYEETSKINPELIKAQERLETLLTFQESGAERTKIIDNASDFEMPNSNSGNMWLSPVERALHLKKKQKQLRKQDGVKKVRSGRGNRAVEMVIKDGKVTMVEKHAASSLKDDDESEEDEEITGLENQIKESRSEDESEEDEEITGLENQIKESRSENENVWSKNIWDYNKYSNKWEKPLYLPSDTDFQKLQSPDQQVHKPRVQLSNDAEENELLVSLPS